MSRIYPLQNESSLIETLLKVEPNVTSPPADGGHFARRGAMTDGCGHIHTNTEADVSTYGLPPRFHRQS